MEEDSAIGYNLVMVALFLNGLVYLILGISRPDYFLSMDSGTFLLSIVMITSIGSIVGALGMLRDEEWSWYVAFYTTMVIVAFEIVVPLFISKGFEFLKIVFGLLVMAYLLQKKGELV